MNPEQAGARIHHSDPFATPEGDKSPVRRLRGRLAAPVTLWTAPGPAGLTVSSVLVADGDPGRVLGLIDPESDFWDAAETAGRFAVTPLGPDDRQLADRFGGLLPAPGGLFATGRWAETRQGEGAGQRAGTDYGPVPAAAGTWAGCRLDGHRAFGWGLLVEATVETVRLEAAPVPLVHVRGRYHRLAT